MVAQKPTRTWSSMPRNDWKMLEEVEAEEKAKKDADAISKALRQMYKDNGDEVLETVDVPGGIFPKPTDAPNPWKNMNHIDEPWAQEFYDRSDSAKTLEENEKLERDLIESGEYQQALEEDRRMREEAARPVVAPNNERSFIEPGKIRFKLTGGKALGTGVINEKPLMWGDQLRRKK